MSQPTSGLQKNLKFINYKNNVDYSNIRWSLDQERRSQRNWFNFKTF